MILQGSYKHWCTYTKTHVCRLAPWSKGTRSFVCFTFKQLLFTSSVTDHRKKWKGTIHLIRCCIICEISHCTHVLPEGPNTIASCCWCIVSTDGHRSHFASHSSREVCTSQDMPPSVTSNKWMLTPKSHSTLQRYWLKSAPLCWAAVYTDQISLTMPKT